jgi:SnoaL-like domain
MAARTTRAVIEDHLDKRLAQRFEDDLRDNYADDVPLFTCTGVFRGHDGVRESKRILDDSLPRAKFEIFNFLDRGEFAFVEWRATADGTEREGADSFIVRGGRIVA